VGSEILNTRLMRLSSATNTPSTPKPAMKDKALQRLISSTLLNVSAQQHGGLRRLLYFRPCGRPADLTDLPHHGSVDEALIGATRHMVEQQIDFAQLADENEVLDVPRERLLLDADFNGHGRASRWRILRDLSLADKTDKSIISCARPYSHP
jgi:hypothetical protein